MMNFEDLNVDCMLHIISYLDLPSQFALRRVAADFDDFVQTHWRHQRTISLSEHEIEVLRTEDIQILLPVISAEVRDLTIDVLNEEHLSILMECSFPVLKTLNISFDVESDHNVLVRPLAAKCPLLTSLTLYGNNSGVHLWYFAHLTELTLDVCYCLSPHHFIRILTTLKLKKFSMLFYGYDLDLRPEHLMTIARCDTLEELHIDDLYLTAGVINQVLALPHLRRLVCYTCDFHEYIIKSVSKLRGKDVVTVMYNDSFWASSLHFDCLSQMSQLRCLVLDSEDIESEQLLAIKASWPQLRELHLTRHREMLTQKFFELIDMPQIELLNLTSTKFSKVQLVELGYPESVKTLLDQRTKPLRIHLAKMEPEEEQTVRQEIAHPKLEISFEYLNIHQLTSRFIQIDFQPLVKTA